MSADDLRHRRAGPNDTALVISLMRTFYAEEHLAFDEQVAERALAELFADSRHGLILLWESASHVVGYMTLTVGFSMEFHGRYALLDELYLVPSVRGRGWGRRCMERAAAEARLLGVKALRLEVNHANTHARGLYSKTGFEDDRRDLFTRWL